MFTKLMGILKQFVAYTQRWPRATQTLLLKLINRVAVSVSVCDS